MSKCKVLSTNHVGLVVEDLDRFLTIMTELFDYRVLDGGRGIGWYSHKLPTFPMQSLISPTWKVATSS